MAQPLAPLMHFYGSTACAVDAFLWLNGASRWGMYSLSSVNTEDGMKLSKDISTRVTLIICRDEVRRTREVQNVLKNFAGIVSLKFDASELDVPYLRKLKEEASALSLFSSKKVFLISHLEELSAELTRELLSIMAESGPENYFILTATKVASTSVLLKTITKEGTVVSLEELSGKSLMTWTQSELKRYFDQVEPRVAEIIMEASEHSPDLIAKMVEQLSLYCDKKSLTLQDVMKLFPHEASAGDFEFLDALTSAQAIRAEALLKNLLESGKNPFMLLSMLARSYANYLSVKSLKSSGVTPKDIQNSMGMTPWVFQKAVSASNKYTLPELRRCIERIVRADSKLKNRSLGPETIFGELIHNLSPRSEEYR